MPMKITEVKMPSAGVLVDDSRLKTRGASPLSARLRSMRPVEYMPELQDDRAAVSTTKLTMAAPAGMPMTANAFTKGLTPSENSVHLTTHRMTVRAPT